ncbi:hypothetical protein ACGWYO_002518 [Enterococcus hirae]
MTRQADYYYENDFVIMSKLEKKLKEAQMQIDNDSSVEKALALFEETKSYLESHDLAFWSELSEPAYLDYKDAKHLLKKPTRFLDRELEEKFIKENPDITDISVNELAKYFNEGCKHSRYPHEFQYSCMQTHYIKALNHIRRNKEKQCKLQRQAEMIERQKEANMFKRLGLD